MSQALTSVGTCCLLAAIGCGAEIAEGYRARFHQVPIQPFLARAALGVGIDILPSHVEAYPLPEVESFLNYSADVLVCF